MLMTAILESGPSNNERYEQGGVLKGREQSRSVYLTMNTKNDSMAVETAYQTRSGLAFFDRRDASCIGY